MADVELVEMQLMDAAQAARRAGLTLVYGLHHLYVDRKLVGCCVTSAFIDCDCCRCEIIDMTPDQQEAIESGWDDFWMSRFEPHRAWWAMGRRLRRALKPVAAESFLS